MNTTTITNDDSENNDTDEIANQKKGWAGIFLLERHRDFIYRKFKPKFEKQTDCHITTAFNVTGLDEDFNLERLKIIGYAGGETIECIVVEVNSKLFRPSGGYYHITLSYNPALATPKDSNVLLKQGFNGIDHIHLPPKGCEYKFVEF